MKRSRRSDPNSILKQRRRWPVAIALLVVLSVLDRNGWLLAGGPNDLRVYEGRIATVVGVLAGDEIEVDIPDGLHGRPTTHIRLWGVRAPHPPRPGREPQPMWSEAAALTESLVLGRQIVVRLESHRTRDPQGSLLAHVDIPRGGTLNEAVLNAGLGYREERWPHTKLTPYAQAENRARRHGEGVWAQD